MSAASSQRRPDLLVDLTDVCRDKVMLGADVGADAARKDDDFQQEGVKGVAAEKEKHWRDGGEF